MIRNVAALRVINKPAVCSEDTTSAKHWRVGVLCGVTLFVSFHAENIDHNDDASAHTVVDITKFYLHQIDAAFIV